MGAVDGGSVRGAVAQGRWVVGLVSAARMVVPLLEDLVPVGVIIAAELVL